MSGNPCGIDGIEFIEFAEGKSPLLPLFHQLGMVVCASQSATEKTLFRQGGVNFVHDHSGKSFARSFASAHGGSACGMGVRVKDAQKAFAVAVERGAQPYRGEQGSTGWPWPAIFGIGDSLLFFVDRYGERGETYADGWTWTATEKRPPGFGMTAIDHLTNNVPVGSMQKWCDFYEKILGFEEVRTFDIKGKQTGLISKVMRSPCGKFSIPINEPSDPKSQIQEYLDEYKGSGIQHVALLTNDIQSTVRQLIEHGIEFLSAPPATYYEKIPARVRGVKESLGELAKLGILVDGDDTGYLLQIFTKNLIGPIFVEVISRKGHRGFGEGNFQALFDSIEEDQRRRGVI